MSDKVNRYWVATQARINKEWVGIQGVVVAAEDYDTLRTANQRVQEQNKDAQCQAELFKRAAEVFREDKDALVTANQRLQGEVGFWKALAHGRAEKVTKAATIALSIAEKRDQFKDDNQRLEGLVRDYRNALCRERYSDNDEGDRLHRQRDIRIKQIDAALAGAGGE